MTLFLLSLLSRSMTPQAWVQLFSVISNISIVLVGVKLIRHISRLEFKVDMMWGVFVRRYGTRSETGDELDLAE